MSEPLIQALENRIEHGEDKADLKTEVLSAGHSEEVFEAAFREAAVRVAERQAEEQAAQHAEERVVSTPTASTPPAANRRPGAGHTLNVAKPSLVGVGDMLTRGWDLAKNTVGYLGAAFLAVIIGVLALGVLIAILGGATMGFGSGSSGVVAAFAIFFVLIYFLAILLGVMVRYVLIKSLLQRRLGGSFWSHLGWGFASLGSIFMLALYQQVFTLGGFIFLIIPGVVAVVYLSQTIFAFAGEDKKGLDALVRSIELVHGNFWSIFLRYAAIFGVVFLASFATSLLNEVTPFALVLTLPVQVFAMYWTLCASVVLFESLQHMYPGGRFLVETKETIKLWLRVAATIGILLLLLAMAALINVAMNAESMYEELLESSVPVVPTIPTGDLPDMQERQEARAAAVKQNLSTIRSQAELYWSENLSYAGVCSEPLGAYDLISRTYDLEIGDVHCADDKDWYLVEAELPDGSFYCVDSSASSEVVSGSRKGQKTCF